MEQQPWGVGEYLTAIGLFLGLMFFASKAVSWLGRRLFVWDALDPADELVDEPAPVMSHAPDASPEQLLLMLLLFHAGTAGRMATDGRTDEGTEPEAPASERQRRGLRSYVVDDWRRKDGAKVPRESVYDLMGIKSAQARAELNAIVAEVACERRESVPTVDPDYPPDPAVAVPAYDPPELVLTH